MTVHIRTDCSTDPAFGCEPGRRSAAALVRLGVILLDKPSGPTSREAAERAARFVGASKVGHGGVLDPKVTGVLPLLLHKAVKAQSVLSRLDKAYRGVLRLHGDTTDEELLSAMKAFTGEIIQVPPVRSRVKRQPRRRRVYSLSIIGRENRKVEFLVACEAGTYIRKLVHTMGQRLGCGAHMLRLRRIRSGPFGEEECVTVQQLETAAAELERGNERPLREAVRPLEDVVGVLIPRIWVDDLAVDSLCHGYGLAAPGVCRLEEFGANRTLALMTLKGELIALGVSLICHSEVLAAQKGIVAEVRKVVMPRGTYPSWRGKG